MTTSQTQVIFLAFIYRVICIPLETHGSKWVYHSNRRLTSMYIPFRNRGSSSEVSLPLNAL